MARSQIGGLSPHQKAACGLQRRSLTPPSIARKLVLPLRPDAGAGAAARIDAALQTDMAREVEVDAIVLRLGARFDADADTIVDGAGHANRGATCTIG